MTRAGLKRHQMFYLKNVYANAPVPSSTLADPEWVIERARQGTLVAQPGDNVYEQVATAITWPAFNLVVGPRDRPGGDFDDVAPYSLGRHHQRINTLREADQVMASFVGSVDANGDQTNLAVNDQLMAAIHTLGSLTHLDIIPGHHVNWYDLRQQSFAGMRPQDLKKYYERIRLQVEDREFFSQEYPHTGAAEFADSVIIDLYNENSIALPPRS